MARHPRRLPEAQYIGYSRHFVTICAHLRARAFAKGRVVALVRSLFFSTAAELACEISAYCFMPDHVHLLIEGRTDTADCRRSIHLGKQRSGYEYKRSFGSRLWQPNYHDRALRNEEDTADVIRYIIENPLRANLVEDLRDPALGCAEARAG